jgi:hypothetical protein
MTELPPVPKDPADLKAWVDALGRDDLMALAQHITGGGLARFAEPRNPEIDLPAPPDSPVVLTVSIELLESEPKIWRRLTLPGDLMLDAVHTLLQAAMGWSESHLHRFSLGAGNGYEPPYFITEFDEEEGEQGTREDTVRLDQVLHEAGDQLTYVYDFGDGWVHRVTLESSSPLTPETREPRCLDGEQACPLEDVGGIWSHHELAAWLRAGQPGDAVPDQFGGIEHARDWIPGGYDPDAFDAGEATEAMRVWAAGEHLPWHGLPEPLVDLITSMPSWAAASDWLDALGPRVPQELDDDEVQRAARPWLAVLDAVGPGVRLTSAGYLPPATVEQIAQASGVSDWWIGKANREDLTPPVAELRETAQALGLLRRSKSMLIPTARARVAGGEPLALVSEALARLPLGKGFDAEAGWFALLGCAAGVSGRALDAGVAQILTDRGWRTKGGARVSPDEAGLGAEPTVAALQAMAGGHPYRDPHPVQRLARAALLGVASGT